MGVSVSNLDAIRCALTKQRYRAGGHPCRAIAWLLAASGTDTVPPLSLSPMFRALSATEAIRMITNTRVMDHYKPIPPPHHGHRNLGQREVWTD